MYADMPDSDDEEERDATDIWEKSVQTGAAAALRNKRGEKQAFLKKDFCNSVSRAAVHLLRESHGKLRRNGCIRGIILLHIMTCSCKHQQVTSGLVVRPLK